MSKKRGKNSTNKKETMLSVKEAAAAASYSTAHITRLIKQEKLKAEQVNREWRIDPASLNNFLEEVAVTKKIQREKVRQERISERNLTPVVDTTTPLTPKDFSPFSLQALTGSVATIVAFVLFFALGSGLQSYNYLAILDVSDSLGEMSFLPESDTSLEALAMSSGGQVLLSTIKDHIWCGAKVVFLNDGRCLYLPINEFAFFQPRKEVDNTAVGTSSVTYTGDSVTNVYPIERETVREITIRDGAVDVSNFVTNSKYANQVDAILRSVENSVGGLASDLADAVRTKLIEVSGNVSIGGALSVTGDTTIGGTLTAQNLSVATVTSGGVITAPYFAATSASSTSTFTNLTTTGQSVFATASTTNLSVSGSSYFPGGAWTSGGKVGIGTTTPTAFLSIVGNTEQIRLAYDHLNYWTDTVASNGGRSIAGFGSNANLNFDLSGATDGDFSINADQFFVDTSTGNIGIGTTTPAQALTTNGSGFFTGGLGIGVATTSNGVLQTSGNALIGGNLVVMGNSTVFGDSTTIGTTTGGTLVINSRVASDLIPQINGTYNIGSPSLYWNDAFIDTLTVNNISAASTSIAGTQSETFTLNSDNVSSDAEDINIIFYRGTVVPNALITWDSTSERFDINQPFFIQNDSSTTTVPTLHLAGTAGQIADVFAVASSSGSSFFNVTAGGDVGIGSTTPSSKLAVAGVISADGGSSTDWNAAFASSTAMTPSYLRGLFSNTATGLTYSNITGVTSLTSGYNIPLTASTTNWNNFFNTPSTQITAGTGLSWSSNTLNSVWTTSGNDIYSNNSGNVGIGTTTPQELLDVSGTENSRIRVTGNSSSALVLNTATSTSKGMIIGVGALGSVLNFDNNGYFAITTDVKSNLGALSGVGGFFMDGYSGNVGIGSSVTRSSPPSSLFEVRKDTGGEIQRMTTVSGPEGYMVFDKGGTILTYFGFGGAGGIFTDGLPDSTGLRATNALQLGTNGDNVRLTIDTTGNVGIGTTTPSSKLAIYGTAGSSDIFTLSSSTNARLFTVTAAGNVGIGTTTPNRLLNVYASNASTATGQFSIEQAGTGNAWMNYAISGGTSYAMGIDNADGDKFKIGYGSSGQGGVGTNTRLTIDTTGNVGIGTTTPNSKLTVQGDAWFGGNLTATGTLAITGATTLSSTLGVTGHTTLTTASSTNLSISGNTYFPGGIWNSSGNVGIGTLSPTSPLDVVKDDGGFSSVTNLATLIHTTSGTATSGIGGRITFINERADGATALTAGISGILTGVGSGGSQNGALAFSVSPNSSGLIEAMRIDSVGNVGIGTTTPTSGLDIYKKGIALTSQASTSSPVFLLRNSLGVERMSFTYDNSAIALDINNRSGVSLINIKESNGFVGIGTTTPSTKLHIYDSNASMFTLENSITNGNSTQIFSAAGVVKGQIWGVGSGGGLRFDAGTTEAMRINSSGNVGIGTTSPAHILDIVSSGSNTGINLSRSGSGGGLYLTTGGIGQAYFSGGSELVNNNWTARTTSAASIGVATGVLSFYTNVGLTPGSTFTPTERMTITSNGNVGIGTTSPQAVLHVWGSGQTALFGNDGSGYIGFGASSLGVGRALVGYNPSTSNAVVQGASTKGIEFNVNNNTFGSGQAMVITSAGNVGIGTTTPEGKLDIVSLSGSATTGRFLFSNLGATDNRTLAFSTNNSGGIGYVGIDAKITNVGTGANLVLNQSGGNVGIGTTTPSSELVIAGGSDNTNGYIKLDPAGSGNNRTMTITGSFIDVIATSNGGAQPLLLQTQGGLGGNVGIGTTTPDARLQLYGNDANVHFNGPNSQTGFWWRETTGRVGINTGSPASSLTVAGNASVGFNYRTTAAPSNGMIVEGRVGIGETSPATMLEVGAGLLNSSTIPTSESDYNVLIDTGGGKNTTGNYEAGIGFGDFGFTNAGILAVDDGTNAAIALGIFTGSTSNIAERIRVTSSGNVGIGTTTPSSQLSIVGDAYITGALRDSTNSAGTLGMLLSSTGSGTAWVASSTLAGSFFQQGGNSFGTTATLGTNDNNPLQFETNNSTRLTIDTNGNVIVGTTTSNARLSVQSTGTSDILNLFETGGTEVFTVLESGNVGIGNITPLAKLYIDKDSIYTAESSAGIGIRSASGDTALLFGADGTNDVAYVQSLQQGVSYTNRPLAINPNGGNVGIGTTSPNTKLQVSGGDIKLDNAKYIVWRNAANTADINAIRTDSADSLIFSPGSNTVSIFDGADAQLLDIYNAGTVAIRLRSNGNSYFNTGSNVGIGTTTPNTRLTVTGSGPNGLNLDTDTSDATQSSRLFFSNGTAGQGFAINNSANTLTFRSGATAGSSSGSTRMVIDSSGNVGIGTTTPQTALSVVGVTTMANASGAGTTFTINSTGGLTVASPNGITHNTTNSNSIIWQQGGTERMRIDTTGNVGIGTTTPDAKLTVTSTGANGINLDRDQGAPANSGRLFFTGSTGAFSIFRSTNNLAFNYGATAGSVSGSTGMVMTSTGNVGIGTVLPSKKLDIVGTAGSQLRIRNTETDATAKFGYIQTGHYTNAEEDFGGVLMVSQSTGSSLRLGGGSSGLNAATEISFYTAANNTTLTGTERMTIDSSGNVGIGTTTPSSKLSIVGDAYITGALRDSNNASGTLGMLLQSTGTGTQWVATSSLGITGGSSLFTDGGSTTYLTATGDNLGVGTSTASAKLTIQGNAGSSDIFGISSSTGARLFTVTSTGNVGIGTTTPDSALSIVGGMTITNTGAFAGSTMVRTDGAAANFYAGTSNSAFQYDDNFDFVIKANSRANVLTGTGSGASQQLTILGSSGRIGITDETPDYKLELQTSSSKGYFGVTNSSDGDIFTINTAGNVGIGTTTPNSKLDIYGTAGSSDIFTLSSSTNARLFTVTAAGNVGIGIGTTSPQNLLHIKGAVGVVSATQLLIEGSTGGYGAGISFQSNLAGGNLAEMAKITADGQNTWNTTASTQDAGLRFFTALDGNVTEKMRIDAAGSVGIGTTPGVGSSRFIVESDSATVNPMVVSNTRATASTDYSVIFYRASNIVGSVQTSLSATSFLTTSDRRVKENIDTTKLGLKDLMNLPVRDFSFKTDKSGEMTTGFIAQELYEIFPWAVSTNGDNGIDPLTGSSTPWSVDYGRITPLLVKSIQDLNLKLEDLATTTTFAELEEDSFTKKFFGALIAWFGNSANGIASIFVSEKICVDGECLTADDIRAMKAAVLDSSGGTTSQSGGSSSGDGTSGSGDTDITATSTDDGTTIDDSAATTTDDGTDVTGGGEEVDSDEGITTETTEETVVEDVVEEPTAETTPTPEVVTEVPAE